MPARRLAVLYGSQTGNAKSIAETLHDEALKKDYESVLLPLNKYKNLTPSLEEGTVAVIICSTTGNGDPPENSDRFWRFIKKRTNSKTLFSNLKYTVLGLGDTNYDKFCFVGQGINRRLLELGASAFYPMACADEGTGTMEETIEPWLEGLWSALDKLHASATEGNTTAPSSPGGDHTDVEASSVSDEAAAAAQTDEPQPPASPVLELPPDLKPLDGFLPDSIADPAFVLPEAEVPKLRSNLWVSLTFEPEPVEEAPAAEGLWVRRRRASSLAEGQYTAEHPFPARVRAARYLTAAGAASRDRRVIHIELDIARSGMAYEPGDAVGVRCPNPRAWVDYVLHRTAAVLPPGVTADTPFTHGGGAAAAALPPRCSLREALTLHADLQSPLRKPALRALAEHCEDAGERRRLLLLASRTLGNSAYAAFLQEQRLSVPELLALFPSCAPPPERLLALLPPLPPRYYSVASSQLAGPDRLCLAFSAVRYTTKSGVEREGLCTSWLEALVAPLLSSATTTSTLTSTPDGEAAAAALTVPIFLRPTKEFYLPGSPRWPCILVGPGTGVAPFIGFLEHREARARRDIEDSAAAASGCWRGGFDIEAIVGGGCGAAEAPGELAQWRQGERKGETWLFFGCRHAEGPGCDWIYREAMEGFKANGVLSRLECAFSRDGDSGQKQYVQHKMAAHGAALAQLLLHEGAYLYICGDGNDMARDVHAAVLDILVEHGGMGARDAAEAFLKDLKERRRYVLDVWS
ncbi:hypothetical protein JKP88DRAFT_269091 [Tribonema minus]|uniref:Methionine synthase reductase n=1 Tax=Tribonema minus TaxID=303371 RepID=A0A835YP71_9STRA|nr:hypothetical protein JKP88DRAFT_269091 [Tribonema minus]